MTKHIGFVTQVSFSAVVEMVFLFLFNDPLSLSPPC